MRLKTLPYLIVGVCTALNTNAYDVPTTIQKKNILLEEFTGIHCGYCPQGHTIAKNMQTAQPESVYVIAVHAGDFATPKSDEPDFRTKDGDIINNTIGAGFYGTGYPSGMINRHVFRGTSPVTGRSDWTKDAKEINKQNASVNLLVQSTFDGNTRELKVKIEGYYTENLQHEFNLLNVAIVQNNIKGPQNGGLVGSDYNHNHMLKDYITPTWGDTIKVPKKGDYFIREYNYTIPQEMKGVEMKAEDLEIIAFVCKDKTEILNVAGIKPVYINYEKELKGTLLSPDREIKVNYGYNLFECKIVNESEQEINSAEFQVVINGNSQTALWNGIIHSFETKPIIIKVNPYEIATRNDYTISLIKLNGQTIAGNNLTGSFNAPADCTSQIEIELQTDLYADENSFTIKDQNGNTVKEFGPYDVDKKAVYKESISLEQGKIYSFEVNDKWGDGIQEPRGYFKLVNLEDKSMITQQFDIKLLGERFFFHTSLTSDITTLNNNGDMNVTTSKGNLDIYFIPSVYGNNATIELYDPTGKKIKSCIVPTSANEAVKQNIQTSTLPCGIYFIKVCENNNIRTLKVIIR